MVSPGFSFTLLEAVTPEVSEAVVKQTNVPVIGCGAGPACHGSVVVTQDLLGLTDHPPRFAPVLGDLGPPMKKAFAEYVRQIAKGEYPAPEHVYAMPPDEAAKFLRREREAAEDRKYDVDSKPRRSPSTDVSGPW